MTSAIRGAANGDGAEGRRWATCLAAALALHSLAVLVLIRWPAPVISVAAAETPAAVMVDLTPAPTAPSAPAAEGPAGPKQQRVRARRRREVERLPASSGLREVEAPPSAEDLPQQTRDETSTHETTARSAVAPPQAAAEPALGLSEIDMKAASTWEGLMLGHLARFRRYPMPARMRAQQGVVYLRIAMNRDGKVLSAKIEKSSGYDLLDQEALMLVDRAQPLPRPPPEVAGDILRLVIPIEFLLNQLRFQH